MRSAFGGMQDALEVRFAQQSAREEAQAVEDYTARLAQVQDPALRKVLAHALKEEREHLALLNDWLKNRGK